MAGQGDFPISSSWVTFESLARGTTFGQSDEALNTLMDDWWFEAGVSEMVGAASLTLSCSGTLGGTGACVGSGSITLTCAGTLGGLGSLVGSSGITLGCSGTLSGTGACAGSASITITCTGTLADAGAMAGTCTLTLTCSGTLTSTTEATVEAEEDPCAIFQCDTCEIETIHPVIRNTGYRLTPELATALADRPRTASQRYPVSYVQPTNIALVSSRKRLKR